MLITKGLVVVGAAAAFLSLSSVASAQAPAAAPKLSLHKVKDNLYYVEGGGGNSSIIIGQTGVVVLDAKTTIPAGKDVVDEISKLTNKPITTVILTHSDPDHVYGLPAFPKGFRIIAHVNDDNEIHQAMAAGDKRVPPPEYLTNKIITEDRDRETIDGVRLTLIHVGPAHTSGDLAVYLPDEKIVIGGDVLGEGDPGVKMEKHATTDGWIKFASELAKLDADTYVRGHADPETKAQLETQVKNAEAKKARIAELVKQGKSLEEVKAAFGETVKPANAPPFPSYTEVVYAELTKK